MVIKGVNLDPYLSGKNPALEQVLTALFDEIDHITTGKYIIEPKLGSLHIVAKSAFLGVHFLKSCIRINIVLQRQLSGKRIFAVDHVSRNRFHNMVNLFLPADVDAELGNWMTEAYMLKA